MVVLAALGSALLYALASVLQHRAATQEPHQHSLRLGLLGRLALRPVWVVGILCDVGGYGLQFVALGHGSLVLVQPLLVSGLLFALPVGAVVNRHRFRALEGAGAGAVVAGLALFLVAANPGPGRGRASDLAWAVTLAATLVPAAVLVVACGPGPSIRRAVTLAAATGLAYGLDAALTKAAAHLLEGGLVRLLLGWQTYALVAVGVASLVVAQSAFQAGPLRASLPTLTVVDPVVSIIVGALAFGEGIATGGIRLPLEVLGMGLLSVGIFLLARSPLVAGEPADQS